MESINIKVLGGGCKKCHSLEDNVKEVLSELNLSTDAVELITDSNIISSYGVAMTPALVINEEVVSSGKFLNKERVTEIFKSKGLA